MVIVKVNYSSVYPVIKITYDDNPIYIKTSVDATYVSVNYSAMNNGGGGNATWGSIGGTLSNQVDLQSALNAKFDDPTGTTSEYIRGDGSLATFPTVGVASEVSIEVRNNTGATIPIGSVVYINGALGNKPTIALAIATGDSTSAQTLGVTKTAISNNTQGYVVVIGKIENIDTSAYTEGTQLYLSPTTAGAYTSTKPYAPNHLVYVAIVTRQHPSLGIIEVNIQNGYELAELHDVDALNPSNNDGIFYNSTSELWEHKSIATVLGYTPGQGTVTSVAATAGTGISVSGSPITSSGTLTITNTAPDQVVALSGSGTTSISGTYPSFTITSNDQYTGTVTSVAATAGTGISISGSPITSSGTLTITNTAPDQVVSLSGSGTTSISGTYPSFTITSNDQYVGTITSITASSPLTGGTITSSGSIGINQANGSTNGYLSSTDWTTFNNKQGSITLTTTGTSGAATFIGNTLNIPQYSAGSSGGYSISTKTANYTETATSGEIVILGDTTSSTFTITLPSAISNNAKITIKKIASANDLIIDGNGSETIDGGTTATLKVNYESITLISNNSNWFII